MNLQVLVSTMHQKGTNLIRKMNINSDAIIINQCERDNIEELNLSGSNIKWINSSTRGLSRSRNLALKNADNQICLISDDDIEYIPNYEKIIVEQFEKFPEADIISFQVEGIDKPFKKYYPKSRKINYITSMKLSSVEIAFRLESIRKHNMFFKESFGAGSSKFIMGEESIFLFEAIRKGLRVIYVPIKIADIHTGESTWFKGFNKEYFISRGAAFTAMSVNMSLLLIFQFAVRRYKLFYRETNIWQAINYMLKGRRQYLIELKRKE